MVVRMHRTCCDDKRRGAYIPVVLSFIFLLFSSFLEHTFVVCSVTLTRVISCTGGNKTQKSVCKCMCVHAPCRLCVMTINRERVRFSKLSIINCCVLACIKAINKMSLCVCFCARGLKVPDCRHLMRRGK